MSTGTFEPYHKLSKLFILFNLFHVDVNFCRSGALVLACRQGAVYSRNSAFVSYALYLEAEVTRGSGAPWRTAQRL